MTLLKYALALTFIHLTSLPAFADQASDAVKLALVVAENSRLESVNVSIDDPAIKGEKSIDGDESSSTIVHISTGGLAKTYIILRDGGGQIRSITLSE
jgi:hypothetical protein